MNALAGSNDVSVSRPAGRFDRPYDGLARLPKPVWLPALVAAVGNREARLNDAAAWLTSLQAGQLPPPGHDFNDGQATGPLRAVVGELGLAALCRGVPALAQQVLRTTLWHLDHVVDLQPSLTRQQAVDQVVQEFRDAWRVETSGLEEELALLRQLGDAAHLPWDQLRGRLRSREWHSARRAAERLARLPDIVALLQRVGRSQARATAPPMRQARPQSGSVAMPMRAVETRIAGAPGEVTGIRFSARLEHMLAAEAALLMHPVGRRLWQARHAEARLLSHDTEAVLVDWRPEPDAAHDAAANERARGFERGPLVLCLDTSGSMQGAPENIAKALVIAAVRTAHAEGRGCYLMAFGGSGELVERDLAGEGGIDALLALMGQGFDGGTDVQTPIERAVALVHEAAWCSADLLIVSDGEFGCVAETLNQLEDAREQLGLVVYGVLLGDRETMGLLQVCDEIHWLRDWRQHVDADDPSRSRVEMLRARPVHSKSLTALYFPNALTGRAARRPGGSAS